MSEEELPEIYIPCCDGSLPIVKINSYLFNKFWPTAKVNFLGFSKPDFNFYNKNHKFHSIADSQDGGPSKWTRYIHNFMKTVESKFVIFMIDDYLLCSEPNFDQMKIALHLMEDTPKIGRFDLTFDSQVEGHFVLAGEIENYKIAQKHPSAEYRISTQPAMWNLDYLLKFLNNDWSPWDFEVQGSKDATKYQQQTLCFVDENMVTYPIRTIAKGAVSRFNPGKFNVLGLAFDTIKEIVSQGFVSEKNLIWGQYKGSPPSFEEMDGYNFHPGHLKYHPTSKTHFYEYHHIYEDPSFPMISVNLFDRNFIHTLKMPSLGYITSQAEKTPRSKKIRYLPYLEEFNLFSGITIFTDHFLTKEAMTRIKSPIRIGWIMEPPAIHPWAYENMLKVYDDLDYIFTFSKELAEKYEKCHQFSWAQIRILQKDWGIHKKDKMYSMVASNKKITLGHRMRHQISNTLSKKHNIDLWGGGYKKFPEHGKILALKPYMFSIVVTNSDYDGFFPDVTDPFITGTVPIFWGTKGVSDFFDERGIIFFNSIEELDSILSNLSEEDYWSRIEYIKNNFNTAKSFHNSDDQLAKMISKVVYKKDYKL